MSGDQREIVIIGGGIVGVCTAYFLTTHPSFDASKHSITLLEATKIAGGSSGKAGGLLALWAYPSCIVPLSFKLHCDLADKHGGADKWGFRRVHCGEYAASAQQDGIRPNDQKGLAKLKKLGMPEELDWVLASGARSWNEIGAPDETAQVHPYLFTTSVAKLAEQQGCKIIIGKVTDIHFNTIGDTVEGVSYTKGSDTTIERLSATDVVLAAGPWTSKIFPAAPISADRAHSIVMKTVKPVSPIALFTEIRLGKGGRKGGDLATPEIYPRPDGTVYSCGPVDEDDPLPATSDLVSVKSEACLSIKELVGSISAELHDSKVITSQACYKPTVTVRHPSGEVGPLVGPTGIKGLILAAGHDCWGIQNGPGSGKVVSELIFDGKAVSADITAMDPRPVLRR